jgi:2-furoyl-CoA dehydrogenase large subunit
LSCPDIGGGFGNKRRPAYLLICALLARAAGRPVKWIEDRIENLTALMHACNGVMDVELAYQADGTLLALSVRDVADEGKNLVTPSQHNLIKLGNIASYRIPAIATGLTDLTTSARAGPTAGSASPSCASRSGMFDGAPRPAAQPRSGGLRLRLRHRGRMPYTTPPGAQYDSGATRRRSGALEASATRAGAPNRPARDARALLGIGIATSIEPAGTNLASYSSSPDGGPCPQTAEPRWSDGAGWTRPRGVGVRQQPGLRTVIAQIGRRARAYPGAVTVARGFDSATTPWLYLSGATRTSSPSRMSARSWAQPGGWRTSSAGWPRIGRRSTGDLELRDGAVVRESA